MINRILFTGHMIDAKDRPNARFPASKEFVVREAIQKSLVKVKETFTGELTGIAGGACGGDILFHELCQEMNISSEIYLALPVAEFKKESVSFAGKEWEERFVNLTNQLPVYVLPGVINTEDKEKNVWERANEWMLNTTLKDGGKHMALIALWDGKGGDGSGGTEHMVNIAKEEDGIVEIININKL